MIPKKIFQISKFKQPDYVVKMIKEQIPSDWEYHNYIDGDEVYYFIQNPIKEFSNIIDKFRMLKLGQHRADLFRYYLLYLNGGVYIDSDAMLYDNINNIIKNYNFVSVKSIVPNTIFNGFIAATPKHQIMYNALMNVYNININELDKSYLLLCKNLYNIIIKSNLNNIKLYHEENSDQYGTINTIDNDTIILKHFQLTKTIPMRKT